MYNVGAILDEFAEFLSDENNESDGHRLADFLQKKSGTRVGPRHVFAHIDAGRFSFKRRISNRYAVTELSENAQSQQRLQKDAEAGSAPEYDANHKEVEGVLQPMGTVRSNPTSPIQNILSPMTHHSVSKSGGGVSGARCRSQSLRRLATFGGRRRTLLEEFDQVSSVFAPPVFSTPASFIAPLPSTPMESVALNNIPSQEKTQIFTIKSVASLQRKQEEVQNEKSRSSDTAQAQIGNSAPSPTIAIENNIALEDIFTDEEDGCTAQQKATGTQPLLKCAGKKFSKGSKSTYFPSYNLALPEHNEQSLQYQSPLNEEINIAPNEEIYKANSEVDLRRSVALRLQNPINQSELDVPIERNIMATEELDAAPEKAVEMPEMTDEMLPVPQEFDNVVGADVLCEEAMPMVDQMADQISESSLVDDRSCDQVSIIPLSRRDSATSTTFRKSKRGSKEKIISEELQKYLDVSKKINKKKTRNKGSNKSKRLLYTKGQSDAEDTIIDPVPRIIVEKSVTSPPLDNRSKFTEHIVPPTSDITMSLRPRKRSSMSTVMADLPLPPPEQFANIADSAKGATEKTTGHSTGLSNSRKNLADDTTFKKPKLPAPKSLRSSKKQNKKISIHPPVSQDLEPPAETTTGPRRSNRTHRLCPPANIVLFHLMYQDIVDRQNGQKRRRIDSYSELSISNEELVSYQKNALLVKQKYPPKVTRSAPRKKERKPRTTSKSVRMPPISEDQHETHANQPSDLPHQSDAINEYRNAQYQQVTNASNSTEEADQPQPSSSCNVSQAASSCSYALATGTQLYAEEALSDSRASSSKATSSRQGSKKVRVRLERTKMPYTTSTTVPVPSKAPATVPPSTMNEAPPFGYDTSATTNITATSASMAENREFLSWLKNAPNEETPKTHRLKVSHCSAADDVIFRDIEGLEYGFYETEQPNSIGYVRFKPQQYRPVTTARARNLHFLVITGKFKITIHDEAGFFGVGDMIIIPKGSHYSIKNKTNAAAVLMIVNR